MQADLFKKFIININFRFPGSIENGDITTTPKWYYLVGDKIVYYCTTLGYKLNSENVLECQEGSQWSRLPPKCVLHEK